MPSPAQPAPSLSDTAKRAERTLSKVFGSAVQLDREQRLTGSDRSKVSRFAVVEGPAGAPASVIVKRAVAAGDRAYDLHDPAGPAGRLLNEWAGLHLLSTLGHSSVPLVPRFYAGDGETGVLVIEDLGTPGTLADLLLGDDPTAAEAGLMAYAAAIGRMHARTAGKQSEYDRLRDALGPRLPLPVSTAAEAAVRPEQLVEPFRAAMAAVRVAPTPGVEADLAAMVRFWIEPGPFLAYTHNDPCPDNCLVLDDAVRLVDFEFGRFGHALVDGVYGRMHFPSCWCVHRLPAHLPQQMEAVYRAELVQGCPAAADDTQFSRAVVEACAYWTVGMFSWAMPQVLERDETWGTATWRQRVLLRLQAFAQVAAEMGHLEALGSIAGAMAATLRNQWPRDADELPLYPAFREEPGASHAHLH